MNAKMAVAGIALLVGANAVHAIRGGRPLTPTALDSLLAQLKHTVGATIWFSWSGGPTLPRTEGQDRLLAQLRAAGVHVELRTDSTRYGRVIRP
ncbi:MAG TPA: hypothetical protein VGP93_12325 [Polyangiaceae bacterium]|nr:hypothetical protein [Polyangiaceae bacterium]